MGKLYGAYRLENHKWTGIAEFDDFGNRERAIFALQKTLEEKGKGGGYLIGDSEYEVLEKARMIRLQEINSNPSERKELEAIYGKVWDSDELDKDFEVLNFYAPFMTVIKKSDGKKGILEFQHDPRYYFNYTEK